MHKVILKQYITILIALFLGLFLSKAQSTDSLTFKLEQDSTDINAFVDASINKNLFWKQHVLSNIGGAVQKLSLEIPFQDSGFKTSAYDPYIANRRPFVYSHNYKFTQLDYKTTLEEGQYISALHTQAFENFSFGIYYQKLLSEGDFRWEEKDHVNTEFRINYHPKDKKYHTSFSLIHNVSEVLENGGFQSDSIYINQTVTSDKVVPVQLSKAANQIKNTEFNWINKYNFTLKNDLKIGLIANTAYRKESEVYQDSEPMFIPTVSGLVDTLPYYPNFYSDSTRTLDSIAFESISQEILLSTVYKSYELKPYAKIAHINYNLGFGQQSATAINFGVYVKGFNDRLNVHLALKNRSDISTSGLEFSADVKPIKQLSIQLYHNEKAPDFFYQKYEGNHLKWDNNFIREKHNRIDVVLHLLKRTTLKAFYHKINGYLFLNENALASQTFTDQSSKGLELNSLIKKGKFTFSNQFLVQSTTGDYLQLPDFSGRIKIAYRNKMLGGALVQPGIQLNYTTAYYAQRYMAPISSFYFQDAQKLGGAFLLDAFVNVKISNFTFYGVFTNILKTQMLKENFVSPNYIGQAQSFNFGIRWNFYDR